MRKPYLKAIVAIAALGFAACSDGGSATDPNIDPSTSGIENPGSELPGSENFEGQIPDYENPGQDNPGVVDPNGGGSENAAPGTENPGGQNPGQGVDNENPGGVIPGNEGAGSENPGDTNPGNTIPGGSIPGDDDSDMEDSRTLTGAEILLKLSGTTAAVENNNGCVTVEDKSATITCPGAYFVTGESSDFQVVVNTPGAKDEGNTGIYLYNATLKSQNAPILVKNADKTVLHLVKGTSNLVEDGNGNHLFQKKNGTQDTAKAAIYAKDDLNIKGAGKLTVKGNFQHGIHCSNDLKIKNGDFTVVAKESAVKGKGSLKISGGTLNITAKNGDGLKSDQCVEANDGSCTGIEEGKGVVEIAGGKITFKVGVDGVQAANYVMISDSTEPSSMTITAKSKGIMAEKTIYANGGTIKVDAEDDALHTNYTVYMNAGDVNISTVKKGIHADSALYLRGSTINIVTSKEGLESYKIFAEGGITSTFATDDAWNAAGGPKENSGAFAAFSESGGHAVISGGYHYLSAKGSMIDVLDANGTAKQTGGVLILEITGESYENGMGGFGGGNFGGGGGWGGNFGGMGGGSGGCSSNMAGGLIDTDAGYEITGGVLLAFGNYSTDIPECSSVTYTKDNFYGSDVAAFKPQYQGNTILYGGEVRSVAQVQTTGMKELKFPNGLVYMYK